MVLRMGENYIYLGSNNNYANANIGSAITITTLSIPGNKESPLFKPLLWCGKQWTEWAKFPKDESKINTVGFYDIHKIVKKNKIKRIPRKLELIKNIKKLGYKASETHFSGEGIRSDVSSKRLRYLVNGRH